MNISLENGDYSAPIHYLNQSWLIIDGTLRNKCQRNLKGNSNIFIQENAFANKMSSAKLLLFSHSLNVLRNKVKQTRVQMFV